MIPEAFTTGRMRAERLSKAHLDELRIMQQDAQMMAMIGGVRDEAATIAYLERHIVHWQEHGFGFWLLRDLATGASAGIGGLRYVRLDGTDDVELGYGLLPGFWGKGLGTEIAQACVKLAYKQLAAWSVVALTAEDNAASQHVLRKVGLAYERDVTRDGTTSKLFRGKRPMKRPARVGILTAGGLAPCLSSAIGGLIERYTELAPDVEILCYVGGYAGLLKGESRPVTPAIRADAHVLHRFGGSPIGNSRVKLTNAADCLKRGLITAGQDPRQVAADQLVRDGIDVLHTIGGDDTNAAAADLATFLASHGHHLTVIGLPKTVDNDVYPIRQSLGAQTAANHGATFFENVVAEGSANPRMLIVHEVMGRGCGWLTAATARAYRARLDQRAFLPEIGLSRARYEIHGVYLPEMSLDLVAEAARLRRVMDELDCVNLFMSEGAGVESIVREMAAHGEAVARDAFGHVKLDAVNPGAWFGKQFAAMIGAEKTLVQKSGYFARSAAPDAADLALIGRSVDLAVQCALDGVSGVVGEDEDRGGELRAIEFDRIKGGKPFDTNTLWFTQLLAEIGQTEG